MAFLQQSMILLLLCTLHFQSVSPADMYGNKKCEPITIPMCKRIGYNVTGMPNEFNHETQDEAGLEVHQFWPLVEINCSPDLKFFLCSMYVPICIEHYHAPVPACREVCLRAKAGCAPLMHQYGFDWPERMNCDKLPQYGKQGQSLCMDQLNGSLPEDEKYTDKVPLHKNTIDREEKCKEGEDCSRPGRCECGCFPPLIKLDEDHHMYNKSVKVGHIENCALPCLGVFTTKDERHFTELWISVCCVICCIATLMTVLTYLIDMQRFKYPERPIIFLSACYLMVSIGYIVRVAFGHERVACDGDIVRYASTGPLICTTVFILIFFFTMASSVWWVILSLTWFLAAGLKWGGEAIASYAQYYHVAAWLLPAIKTVAVLARSSVDGDTETGICYVGNQDVVNLRWFVLGPLIIYLIMGISFLIGGFVALFRIRNVIRQQSQQRADKLERLMIRIGIFTVVYTLPATVVIASYFYEQYYKEKWLQWYVCRCEERVRPNYTILLLKYFMTMAVGITSGVWIWSSKTVESWRRFTRGFCGWTLGYQPPARTVPGGPKYPTSGPTYMPPQSVASYVGGSVHKTLPLNHV